MGGSRLVYKSDRERVGNATPSRLRHLLPMIPYLLEMAERREPEEREPQNETFSLTSHRLDVGELSDENHLLTGSSQLITIA